MHRKKIYVFLSGIFLLFYTLLTYSNEHKQKVMVENIHYTPYIKTLYNSGVLSYKLVRNLAFKMPGLINFINVKEGDVVKKDDLLVSLMTNEVDAKVSEEKASLMLAKNNYKRYQKLYNKKMASKEIMQEFEAQLTVAENKLQVALFNQKHSKLYSPSSGIVLKKFVEDNELVNVGQPVLKVADESAGWAFNVGLTDQQMTQISLGDSAIINFNAFPRKTFKGKITKISLTTDPATKVYMTEITMLETDFKLYSGLIGSIKIIPSVTKDVFKIPLSSVVQVDHNIVKLFVYDDNTQKVHLKSVYYNMIDSGYAISYSGIDPKEKIVTLGASFLKEGDVIIADLKK